MESTVLLPKRLKKTRLSAMMPVILGCFASQHAIADVPIVPPPVASYPGDPGTLGTPASWRTAEYLRDWGLTSISADYAYAAGFAGQGQNIGVIDSGYFLGHTVEHGDRFHSVTADGGTTGPTPGFYNQTYNDTHGTHVSGTVGASRDGAPAATNMHGVAFDADVYFGNTHKTDAVYYGLQPAGAADRLLLDNEYMANVYRAVNSAVTANGQPVRIITSSWGSQPSTENYNTYDGLNTAWRYLSTPDGVADPNGHTVHWLQGAIEVARTGTIIQFTAGNGGYANTTPRGSSTYFMPELEGRWYTTSAVNTNGRTFDANGDIVVPGTQQYNQCGVAKWACVTAPGNAINSTVVSVIAGVPTAAYGSSSGTSMAGPHSAATLGLIMQRFPYMTNEQALYTMYTTSRQNATINNSGGTSIPNPTAGQMVVAPDNRNGWGTVNLKDAMKGPGQLMGVVLINTQGFNDIWSNNISDAAARARKVEDTAEAAAWQATKDAKGWNSGVPAGSSGADFSDYAIGVAREQARSTRAYTGSLAKGGQGTLFLTGNETFQAASVTGGALSVNGSFANGVTVNAGTLSGTGNIAGTVILLGGLLSPGLLPAEVASAANGTLVAGNLLTLGALKIGASGGFAATVRSASDYTHLQVGGTTVVGGTLFLTFEGTPPPGSVITLIHTSGSLLGTFKGLPEGTVFASGGHLYRISYQSGSVTLTQSDVVVPG